MQFIDSGLLGLFVVMLFGVKGTGYDSQGLLFPVADLGGMNTVFCSQLIDGVVCGRGRNPTLRLWPAIFSGEIDVFPSERRNMGQEIGR